MLVELLPQESSAPASSPCLAGAHIIDAFVVFKRAHNFKLASAHRLFCGASVAHVGFRVCHHVCPDLCVVDLVASVADLYCETPRSVP